MKIDWLPSPETIKKANRIAELKKQGNTYEEIASIFKNHRTYIIALHTWFKNQLHKAKNHAKYERSKEIKEFSKWADKQVEMKGKE